MLLLMLGAVLLLMRQLQQPKTSEFLGRVFTSPANQDEPKKERQLPGKPTSEPSAVEDEVRRKPAAAGPWAAVTDNALFLPAEHEAWFLLWDDARKTSPTEIERRAVDDVTYAQLVNQPNVYRGQSVRVRGRVLRESVKRAPKNSFGIAEYHQLFLAPVGGGDWPVVVYCLDLPLGFPRGDGLKEDLTATGLFFKNWSYPYDGGMGLAPVLVTKTIDWTPPVVQPPAKQKPMDPRALWVGAAAAMLAAVGFMLWVARQTRRPSPAEASTPDFRRIGTDL